jgi:hypothetical protein
MKKTSSKPLKILGYMLLVNVLLVSTHLGEFWPFSIYPMFSQAGNPWTRAMITEISDEDSLTWETTSREALNGTPVSVKSLGVDQIDYSNFVSKTQNWTTSRLEALRYMIGEEHIQDRNFVIFKVNGRLSESDSVVIEYTPQFLFAADTTILNPYLNFNSSVVK